MSFTGHQVFNCYIQDLCQPDCHICRWHGGLDTQVHIQRPFFYSGFKSNLFLEQTSVFNFRTKPLCKCRHAFSNIIITIPDY